MTARISFIIALLTLSGCSLVTTETLPDKVSLHGTIIENPSQLAEQSEFLLVDEDNDVLLAYITSTDVALGNFIDRQGLLEGKIQENNSDNIPKFLVEKFTPDAPLSLEDILLQTTLREARKTPYNYTWNKETVMIVLQNDNANGSAQVKVSADTKEFLIKLVKKQGEWHIAEIIKQEYSPVADESTGSGAVNTASGALNDENSPNT